MTLAENSYGKSRVRLVRVTRHPDRHDFKDLTIDLAFEGDFETCYTEGDNSRILPTDTMKNTVYALARLRPVEQIEEFGVRLLRHFVANDPQISNARIEIAEHLWTRIPVEDRPHASSFLRSGSEKRIAIISGAREGIAIESGIAGMVILKTAGSAFEGFIKDRYTTLKETSDRILGTAVRAVWLYRGAEIDFDRCWDGIRKVMLETFAAHASRSVQHTLYAMGDAALRAFTQVDRIRLSMPNKHCLLVDLAPFGMDNPNEVFVPVDEPHGLIEAVLRRGEAHLEQPKDPG